MRTRRVPSPIEVTEALLRRWPLPQPGPDSDKEKRGRVLLVAGATSMPGAAILAAIAGLRAGAGKMQIATCSSIATQVGCAVPEAFVAALPQTGGGCIAPSAARRIVQLGEEADAVCIGPGMDDERVAGVLMRAALPRLLKALVVLDASALAAVGRTPLWPRERAPRAILTPHAGEMAMITGRAKSAIQRDPVAAAMGLARAVNAIVVLKGAETVIADPRGPIHRNRRGNPGLGTAGSGDVLAGIIAGLAARGATVDQAAVWGVHLHATCGDVLARRVGPLGYLARELSEVVPVRMAAARIRA